MKENKEKIKKALFIVDMIKGFRSEGNMKIPNLENIDKEVLKLTKEFLTHQNDIIAITESHKENSIEFKYFPKHCIENTSECELIDDLIPYQNKMKLVRKNSTSGYITEGIRNYLNNNLDLKEIIIVGLCTDICVLNLAIPVKNHLNEYNIDCDVIVPMNATDTFNNESHNKEEYKTYAKKIMNLNGIKTPNRYGE